MTALILDSFYPEYLRGMFGREYITDVEEYLYFNGVYYARVETNFSRHLSVRADAVLLTHVKIGE